MSGEKIRPRKRPRKRLTDRMLSALRPRADRKPLYIMDELIGGFGVRVTGTPACRVVAFVLEARYPGGNGYPSRPTISRYPEMSLNEGRDKARDWLMALRRGADPRDLEKRARHAELRRQENSFASVAESFIRRHHASKTRTAAIIERDLRREFIERWGDRLIGDITSRDVVAVIDEVAERAPAQARNLLGHVRSLFAFAVGRGALARSPCDGLRPAAIVGTKVPRQHVLEDHELRALWHASSAVGYPYGTLYQLLMLAPVRRGEAAGAKWGEFDLKARTWAVPATRMKMATPFVVPLTDAMIELLETIPRFVGGDHLFSVDGGKSPVSGFSKSKTRLDEQVLIQLRRQAVDAGEDPERVGLTDFRVHDIRRSTRTRLSALPVPGGDVTRELLLAHAQPGLHQTYDLHTYIDEKRAALVMWQAKLRAIVEPRTVN
ncbi:MAG TPA: site-specific integrase, partial [Xanthobacteraceae bacterium]|nr:site-specific integrase [Xanthobacteraceae bacterium]